MAHYDRLLQLSPPPSPPQQQGQRRQQGPEHGRDVGGAAYAEVGDTNVMHLVGPPLWETMHYAAFQCPEPFAERAPALLSLVRAYATLLPCAECRGHFAALLAAHPPEEAARGGRQAFARWTVDAHNMVNARLGKPLVTFEQAAWRYARGDLCCRDSPTTDRPSSDGPPRRLLPMAAVAVALVALVVAGAWLYYTRVHAQRSAVACAQDAQQGSPDG
ncbi:Erv-family thiol oxidoreductase [Pandoravirus kuranda]|uniref:Sulfhydryl oxidase n=1 Tax=Pandoravirus kuranda TaxID=3019033 RepID=A0AA95EMX5_9VIRU|nr:Erv-family thiol oxidoreductase [Pandoravirus kuranda]